MTDQDERERRKCNVCGEYWLDTGSTFCPFCHSEDTEPMSEEDGPEADESQ